MYLAHKAPPLIPINHLNLFQISRAVVHHHLKPHPHTEHRLVRPLGHSEQNPQGAQVLKPGQVSTLPAEYQDIYIVEAVQAGFTGIPETGVVNVVLDSMLIADGELESVWTDN